MNEPKYATTPKCVAVRNIFPATWNTHAPSKSDDTAFQGLVESIKANGMLHRIVVREISDPNVDGYEVIDGHRRLEAATALGWDTVPCEVVIGLTDEDAQAMTLTANVQRLENDPLLEAACIQRLADCGRTYAQIAAILGKGERYVARRARLCNLTGKWRGWFQGVDAGADVMELVAAHEANLQDEVFDALHIATENGVVDEDDIAKAFAGRLRRLDGNCPFDTAECASCPFNTATHGWLFPAEEDDGCVGRCEKASCFVRTWNSAVDERIAKLRKKKVEVLEAPRRWDVPSYWTATTGKNRTNTQPWVYTEDGLKHLVWVEPKTEPKAAPALTEEEKAERLRVKKAHNAWKKNRENARKKMSKMLKAADKPAELADALLMTDGYREYARTKAIEAFSSGWTSDWTLDLAFRCLGSDALVAMGCAAFAPSEIEAMSSRDPADEHRAEDGADDDNGEEA